MLSFLSKSDGGAVLIAKIDRKNEISIYIPVANFFTPKCTFFVIKLFFRNSKFLFNYDHTLSGILPLPIQLICPMATTLSYQNNKQKIMKKNSNANSKFHNTEWNIYWEGVRAKPRSRQ